MKPGCIDKEAIYEKKIGPKPWRLIISFSFSGSGRLPHLLLTRTIRTPVSIKMNESIIFICLDSTSHIKESETTGNLLFDDFDKIIHPIAERILALLSKICTSDIAPIYITFLKRITKNRKGGLAGVIVRRDKLPEIEVATTKIGSFEFAKGPGKVGEKDRAKVNYKKKEIFDQYSPRPGLSTKEIEWEQ